MATTTRLIPVVLLATMTLNCQAGPTTVIRVTARVVHPCEATAEALVNCTEQTLRFQSTLRGSANVIANDGEPSVHFIGPQPVLEKMPNRLTVLF
jgi:hypothetical protein